MVKIRLLFYTVISHGGKAPFKPCTNLTRNYYNQKSEDKSFMLKNIKMLHNINTLFRSI